MSGTEGDEPGDGGRPLRVVMRAADPVRRAGLASLVRQAGHAVAETGGDVLLADLADHEDLPTEAEMPVLILSDDEARGRDVRLGGVLPRAAASPARLDAALRAVAAGLFVRAPEVVLTATAAAARGFAAAAGEEAGQPSPPLLTPREVEILTLVGEGLSNKAVARRLGISAHTVKFHLESVFAKLGAASRAEAVARGLRGGAIEL